jgi:hypothetical protein
MCQPQSLAATVTVMVSSVFVKIPVRSCGIAAAAAAAASAANGAQRKQYVHIASSSCLAPSAPLVLLQRHPTVTSRTNIRTSIPPLHSSLPRDHPRWSVRGTCMIGAGRRGAPYFTYLGLPFILSPPPPNPFSLRLRLCQANTSAPYHHDFCCRSPIACPGNREKVRPHSLIFPSG